MLNYLRIRNLALIEDLELEPGPGLVAVTGETGAGKSIILDGLALVTGERASTEMVRAGSDEAVIEGIFRAEDPGVDALLEEAGLAGPGEILVRRVVGSTGSRAYVNDEMVTVGLLHDVGERLVDIAGQHESQVLLRPRAQLQLLDAFGGHDDLLREVREAYGRAVEIDERLRELQQADRELAQRVDWLRFQVQEIRGADLSEQEEEELQAERRRLRHAEELASSAREAMALLYEEEESTVALLGKARRLLRRIADLDPDSGLGPDPLEEASILVEELSRSLQEYADEVSADPRRLDVVEERLAVIDELRRKYGDSVAEILETAEAAERELRSLENREEEIEELSRRLVELGEAYDAAAAELTRAREGAATRLADEITSELQELGMDKACFDVQLRPGKGEGPASLPPGAGSRGYEGVEFLLAANPGEPARPLAKVASGGELSRVLLALKLAVAGRPGAQTLVFDEVDAGVGGGRVAEKLAERLADLARSFQVLVVTHLPQIAGRAEAHFQVRKAEEGGRTRVSLRPLNAAARVEELARMLGGVEVTESLREHARSLLGAGR